MKERRPKIRGKAPELPPLSPEAAARLKSQVDRAAAALAEGEPAAAAADQVSPAPEDTLWDLHLLAALGTLNHPETPALLARLFGGTPDKVRRKALKKTLHLLATRGVPVPADLLPREEAAIGTAPVAALKAYVTPIFGQGESYVILEAPPELLGGNFLVSLLSDREGFLECHLLNIKRRQQAEFWQHFQEQGLGEWFTPPPAFVVGLLEEAYLHRETGGGAERYGALRPRIKQHWGPAETPDLARELPVLTPGERRRYLEDSRKLSAHPSFMPWMPAPAELAAWLERLQQVEDSPLVLSEQQRQVRAEAVVEEAVKTLYPPESRPLWGRRLLLMAYYLDHQGLPEEARAAQAAGEDLAAGERGPLAGENSFLKALVQNGLKLVWELHKPKEAPEPTGLVAPPGESLLIRR